MLRLRPLRLRPLQLRQLRLRPLAWSGVTSGVQHGTSGVTSDAWRAQSGVRSGAQVQLPEQLQLLVQLQLRAQVSSLEKAGGGLIGEHDQDPELASVEMCIPGIGLFPAAVA